MALIRCPECGKEVSDQAKACIHCGYPLEEAAKAPLRYALVLVDPSFDYYNFIARIQPLGYDADQAKALAENAPSVLQRGLTYEEGVELVNRLRPYGNVKLVYDGGEEEEALKALEPTPLPTDTEEKQGMSFGGTVGAVILGVIAALLILSFL